MTEQGKIISFCSFQSVVAWNLSWDDTSHRFSANAKHINLSDICSSICSQSEPGMFIELSLTILSYSHINITEHFIANGF